MRQGAAVGGGCDGDRIWVGGNGGKWWGQSSYREGKEEMENGI